MTRSDIERLFRSAARRLSRSASLLLFGGGAAIVQTSARATDDVDLEILPSGRRKDSSKLDELLAALNDAGQRTGIRVQAGEQVHRWSMIDWGDYRKHVRLWKSFGGLSVYLLEPEYFALTKLPRSGAADIRDIVAVFKATKASWKRLAVVCGRALRSSPRSTSQGLFRRQVEHFFMKTGPRVWGRSFDPNLAISAFQQAVAASRRRSGSAADT